MRKCVFILMILCLTTFSYGQEFEKSGNESAEEFVKRLKPENSEVTHKVVETNWNSKPVIIAFYEQSYKLPLKNDPSQQEYNRVLTTVFIQTDNTKYEKFDSDIIDNEGGAPQIESVFFANADKDTARELIVIVTWQQQHYDFSGTLYGTFVFDDMLTNTENNLKFLSDVSEKVSGGCECSRRNGKNEKAKFKNAKAVVAELTRLGYKQ